MQQINIFKLFYDWSWSLINFFIEKFFLTKSSVHAKNYFEVYYIITCSKTLLFVLDCVEVITNYLEKYI